MTYEWAAEKRGESTPKAQPPTPNSQLLTSNSQPPTLEGVELAAIGSWPFWQLGVDTSPLCEPGHGRRRLARLEIRQRSADADRRCAVFVHHLGGLVAVAGDADDDRLVAAEDAALDQLARRRDGDAAGRLGEDPFGF